MNSMRSGSARRAKQSTDQRILSIGLTGLLLLSACTTTWDPPVRSQSRGESSDRTAAASLNEGGATAYQTNVGEAIGDDTVNQIYERILNRYSYRIDTATELLTPPTLYRATQWEAKQPFPDEISLGVQAAQTRLIMTTRSGSTTLGSGEVELRVTVRVEHQVRIGANGEWTEVPMSPQFERYAQTMLRDMELELRSIRE